MNIIISSIGKFRNSPHKEVFEAYLKRLPWKIELKELEVKNSLSGEALKQKEGELLIASSIGADKIILLDEKGKSLSSKEFSKFISDLRIEGNNKLAFIIGGADGVREEVKSKANIIISLGKMTLPHLMVRSVLAEQLYRAYSIINNHPYHRE